MAVSATTAGAPAPTAMVLLDEGRPSNILDPPHYAGWYPADPSSIPKSTQELWLSRPSTPLVDPDVFSRRRNFVESDLHVLLAGRESSGGGEHRRACEAEHV